jgi:hypothetical protein
VRTDLKRGDKFLLPVEIELDTNDNGWTWVLTKGYRSQTLTSDEAKTLIPANRLTDLEAENARLREALDVITKGDKWKARAIEAMIKKVDDTLAGNDQ